MTRRQKAWAEAAQQEARRGNDMAAGLCSPQEIAALVALGVVEECDDGNSSNQDSCSTTCELALCGDGAVQAAVEECDDGNREDGDGCSAVCRQESLHGDRKSVV